jgi:hypothetical protein
MPSSAAHQSPPQLPRGLRLRYSLMTLFLLTTAAGCCVGCPVAFVRWLDGDSTIATFRGTHRRSVTITTPNFIDSPGQPIGVRFYEGRTLVEQSAVVVEWGRGPDAEDFAVSWLDDGDVAVAFTTVLDESGYWQAIATYRHSTKESFDEDDELPSELARRISAQFAREHPGAGPINVLRREPSIVKE